MQARWESWKAVSPAQVIHAWNSLIVDFISPGQYFLSRPGIYGNNQFVFKVVRVAGNQDLR